MSSLARVSFASASFTERKTISLLTVPVMTSGTLAYQAPGRMEKVTVSPQFERFVLDGELVTITGADREPHRFSLLDAPQIAVLTEGVLATLAGDLPRLERRYTFRLAGDASDWELVLTPRDAAFVRSIAIHGCQNRIRAIDTQATNGDHSEMSVIETIGNAL